jgi:shikimate dehydrogenase
MNGFRVFGLIGRNISYSFSQKYFTEKFKAAGLNCEYRNFDIADISQFPDVIKNDVVGLNVTIPYKEKIISFLDDLSDEALKIGAVNTIKIRHGKLIGFNTDWMGFCNSIKPLLKAHHRKALILGTGGASKAVAYAFEILDIQYLFVSRDKYKDTITYDAIDEKILSEYQIIVNCTPVGTSPGIDQSPNVPYHLLNSSHLLYDLIYNPEQTLFLQKGQAAGAVTKNGYEMLVLQAEESWRIWNDSTT